ncbi:hypothetical protein [Haliangium sp.]|uniref:hypothetical protein n=1 Tax=Haliangium sp. TaxID=2663208 RepID=UPI003D0E3AA5
MKIPRDQIRRWLQQCKEDEPLDPQDRRYVALEDFERDGQRVTIRGGDWTQPLFDCIDLAGEQATAQLFSGYIGTGKSTELRRLTHRLEEAGYDVLLIDAERYHDLAHPLMIQDLLVILAGAFGEKTQDRVGKKILGKGYWERFLDFLQQEIDLKSIRIPGGVLDLQASVRHGHTSFWRDIQRALEASLGRLGAHVHGFIRECVAALESKTPDKRGVVFIFDSLERLRGSLDQFYDTMESVGRVFDQHAQLLHLPGCHCIYTVPPYAELIHPNLARRYSMPIHQPLPAVKVTQRGQELSPHRDGIDKLAELTDRRIPLDTVFGDRRDLLDKLILYSGGHVRTLINFIKVLLIRNVDRDFPPSEAMVQSILDDYAERIRESIRPEGVQVLDSVRRTASLADIEDDKMPLLARYVDNHIVLCYRNGEGWYELHPLIREHIRQRAEGVAGAARP